MLETAPLDRRKIILDAAFSVFVAYGFKRTTMADIAEAAGISRPALYLLFRNKSEIYAAKFLDMLDEARLAARKVMAEAPDFRSAMLAAIDVVVIAPYRMLLATPHGAELFEMKKDIESELPEQWFSMVEQELVGAIEHHAATGRLDKAALGMPPDRFARLAMCGIEGIKMRMTGIDQAQADIRDFVDIICRAIEKRS